jgi:hypothetical protein
VACRVALPVRDKGGRRARRFGVFEMTGIRLLAGPRVIWALISRSKKSVNRTTARAKRQASPLPYRRDVASDACGHLCKRRIGRNLLLAMGHRDPESMIRARSTDPIRASGLVPRRKAGHSRARKSLRPGGHPHMARTGNTRPSPERAPGHSRHQSVSVGADTELRTGCDSGRPSSLLPSRISPSTKCQ